MHARTYSWMHSIHARKYFLGIQTCTHTDTHTHTTQVARNPASVLYPPDLWRRLNQEHEQGQIDPASAGFPAIHPPPKLGTLATPLTVTLELAELEKAFHDSALRTSAYLDSAAMANGTNHKPASEQEPPDLWPLANEPPKTYLVPSNGTQAYLDPTKDRVGTVALGEVPSVDWLRSEAAKESPRDPCYPRTSRPLGVNAAADASRAAPGGRNPRETPFFAREPTPAQAQAPSWLGSIMSLLTPRGTDGAGVANAPADNGKPPAGRGNTTADNGGGHDSISSSFAWVPKVPVSAVARGTGTSCTELKTRTQ